MNTITSLPNLLTLLRIIAIPIFIIAFYLPVSWAHLLAALIFAVACLTDLLDGYLARKLKLISPFGAFLDPVADKLIIASSLVLLVGTKNIPYITIPAVVIVGREIVVSALREWMAEIGKRASVTVSYVGKFKTAIQMVAIFLLIGYVPLNSWWGTIGFIMLYMAAILTMWSMIMYLIIAWPQIKIQKI